MIRCKKCNIEVSGFSKCPICHNKLKGIQRATSRTTAFYELTKTKKYKEAQWLKFQSPKTKAEQAIIEERVKDVDLTIMRHRYNRKP